MRKILGYDRSNSQVSRGYKKVLLINDRIKSPSLKDLPSELQKKKKVKVYKNKSLKSISQNDAESDGDSSESIKGGLQEELSMEPSRNSRLN
jgi:hypothetical protein